VRGAAAEIARMIHVLPGRSRVDVACEVEADGRRELELLHSVSLKNASVFVISPLKNASTLSASTNTLDRYVWPFLSEHRRQYVSDRHQRGVLPQSVQVGV
jgi:hypothetical protein